MEKSPIVRGRVRRPPREGWSWIDRRFLREHAPSLSGEAILLYFFLVAASDRDGLSYWSDASTAARLRLSKEALPQARKELLRRDLIAHRPPLTQVLSLPAPSGRRQGGPPQVLAEIFRDAVRRSESSDRERIRP